MSGNDDPEISFRSYIWDGEKISGKEFLDKLNKVRDDPDYCGLGSLNSGPHDPWWRRACIPHDKAYEQLKQSEWTVFGTFAKNISKGMLQGAWMLLSGPLYLLVGGLGGVIRYQQLKKRKKLKEQNDNLPPSLGDGL